MSDNDDDEDDYEYSDNEMEEENLQYTDDEEEQDDTAVALENAYYNAKGNRTVEAFEQVIQLESMKPGIWTFKAMKQLVKLHLRQNNNDCDDGATTTTTTTAAAVHVVVAAYERLLTCVASHAKEISPAAVEKGIGSMLDRVGSNSSSCDPLVARSIYDATLKIFHPETGPCKNERLWFKTNLKYGQSLFQVGELGKLHNVVLKELTSHETTPTNTMEILALQMQLYEITDTKKLRETFQKAMDLRGGIPHPRTIALIQELGGKMHMQAREYAAAEKTFFQAFKSYDEAGDIGRLRCLKYLVLASMLSTSSINPFDSQEARPYKEDPEIVNMTNLVQAFHDNDIHTFERTLRQGRIMEKDDFIRQFVSDLLRTIRTQVIMNFLRPYQRIRLSSIAKALNDISIQEVESLLVCLILDGNVKGKIDATEGILVMDDPKKEEGTTTVKVGHKLQCAAMNKLLDQLAEVAKKTMKENTSSSSASMGQLRSVVGM